MRKDKRLIVISGGSKGIGKAIIESFAANGFDIATFSRNEKEINNLKKEVEKEYNVSVFVKAIDITNREEVNKFAADVLKLYQHPTVLVNNAGIFTPGQIQNEADGVLEDTMNVNLNGSYYLTRAFLPSMIKAKKGHVFTMCSIASITAYTNSGSYCISKFALLGFNKVLREEMKEHNIKVTSILPGATYTASWEGAGIPEDRFMSSKDIADTVWAAYNLGPQAVVEEIVLRPILGDI
ncbi:MAG: SDR family oxidoreductase [Cyclobacteriaceae bacterium]|nr:SDR family oxidoreductase [Cyclobacteriaceae bacterium]